MLKPLTVWKIKKKEKKNLWKILKEMEIPDDITCLLRTLYGSKAIGLDIEQWTDSKMTNLYIVTLLI